MNVPAPHFLLYSEAARTAAAAPGGRWRFVLAAPSGDTALEAADEEQAASAERLELLAIVRGLEALDQPSTVTLMTRTRDIQRGLQFGLAHWREHDWQWERYGQMTPVKNADLWKRIDRLLEIHQVRCRPRRLTSTDDLTNPPRQADGVKSSQEGQRLRFDRPPTGGRLPQTPAQSAPGVRTSRRDERPRASARRLHQRSSLWECWRNLTSFFRKILRMARRPVLERN